MIERTRHRTFANNIKRRPSKISAANTWIAELEHGDDVGLFGPGSAVWAVNGDLPTAIAGIRALMMQSLHPAVMAGMVDHSNYHRDPITRLNRTIRWVATTTFGDTHAAAAAAQGLRRVHDAVNGSYTDAAGADHHYSAHDPELLRWVHLTFTEALLGAHLIWGTPIPGGPDEYVQQWGRAGTLMGIDNPPTTAVELRYQLTTFDRELRYDDQVAEAIQFLRHPPLPPLLQIAYPVLYAGAVASLPAIYRDLLQLRTPRWPAITINRLLLGAVGALLHPVAPGADAARRRIQRLAQQP